MPTILDKTFALLTNLKPPSNNAKHTTNFTVTNPDITDDTDQTQTNQTESDSEEIPLESYNQKPDISIWKAAEMGDFSALKYYIQHTNGVDSTTLLNTRDPELECTLLHLVVSNNKDKNVLPLVKLLLENGADATARNVYNVQAIHMICLHCPKPLSAIELLLDHKVSPNARDGDGWTPLHYAARFCNPPEPVLKRLIERGADINLTDAGHKSPLFGLLANGDLATSLDWLIHNAKADLKILGDFLDPVTRKTRRGTIVLQAAKYARLDCLALLIRSPLAIRQLKRVLDGDELVHAIFLVKENKSRLIKANAPEQHTSKLDMVLQLLKELEDELENDPTSLFSLKNGLKKQEREKLVNTDGSQPSSNTSRVIQRRHNSLLTILGSIRKNNNKSGNSTENTENRSSAKNPIFRKMSHMIRRSKSENNAQHSTTLHSGQSNDRQKGTMY